MALKHNGFWSTVLVVALAAGLSAQTPAPVDKAQPEKGKAQPDKPQQEKRTFRVQVDLVTNDVMVRDAQGNFVADLTKDDFEIYEDGVKQDIISMNMSHGGRVTNVL